MLEKQLELLGRKVADKVTGFEGVVTSISFDLYGCIQVLVNPGMDKDGKLQEQTWFDSGRLKVLSNKSVMSVPDYSKAILSTYDKGPAQKPLQNKP